MTGAEEWGDQIEQWRDVITADLDRVHDDLCEQELIGGPLVYSPCGCGHRPVEKEPAPEVIHTEAPCENEHERPVDE